MNSISKSNLTPKERLLNLLAKDSYRYGDFTLASGRKSNHYVNCKTISLSGIGLELISHLLIDYVDLEALAVAGLTLGADPLVSGVAMKAAQSNRHLDALIVRKSAKGHGTEAWLEGPLPPKGSLITVLEDVVTTGGSSIKAVNHLRDFGYLVNRVVTVVDRQEGANVAMHKEGLKLDSIFLLEDVAARFNDLKEKLI
tara:strand:+ start:151 stop:744 length:594 start_codon:yes stop_codon:yes gene_type:complete